MTTRRGKILLEAKNLTEGDRNRTYGDPAVQLSLAGELKAVVHNAHMASGKRAISAAEWEAIDMVLSKVSRIVLGPKARTDSYVDLAAYAAIAGEIAEADGVRVSADGFTVVSDGEDEFEKYINDHRMKPVKVKFARGDDR